MMNSSNTRRSSGVAALFALLAVLALVIAAPMRATAAGAPDSAVDGMIISAHLGIGFLDSNDVDFDGDSHFVGGGDARFTWELVTGWSAQVELFVRGQGQTDQQPFAGPPISDGLLQGGGGLHFIYRNPSNYAFGVFAAGTLTTFVDDPDNAFHLIAGIEGALFQGPWTFFGQFGYVDADADFGDDRETVENGVFGLLGLRYFFTEDDKLELSFAAAGGNVDSASEPTGASDGRFFQWIVEYEQQLKKHPFAWFIRYTGNLIDENDPGNQIADDALENNIIVGLTLHAGQATLKDQERKAAGTFKIIDLSRWFSYTDNL